MQMVTPMNGALPPAPTELKAYPHEGGIHTTWTDNAGDGARQMKRDVPKNPKAGSPAKHALKPDSRYIETVSGGSFT